MTRTMKKIIDWFRRKKHKETDEYLRNIYFKAQKVHLMDWVAELLEEYGYPPQPPEMLSHMTDVYIDRMEGGDALGELEHYVFENMMDYDFPEIDSKEEEDE